MHGFRLFLALLILPLASFAQSLREVSSGARVFKFVELPGVASDILKYSRMTLEVALNTEIKPDARILVLGSGTGADALQLAERTTGEVIATDIDPVAVYNTEINALANGVANVRAQQADLFEGVEGRFDLIVFNAPRAITSAFLPDWFKRALTPELYREYLRERQDERDVFDARGKLLRKLLREVPQMLAPGGQLVLMTDSQLERILPRQLRIENVSGSFPWSSYNEGSFAVFRCQVVFAEDAQ